MLQSVKNDFDRGLSYYLLKFNLICKEMFKSIFPVFLIVFLVIGNNSSLGADSATPFANNIVDRFLTSLPGTWNGQAIETPIGPVNYPITFHNCVENVVAGVAELNASDHHWRFWKSNNELRLTFLSTFRGNQQPTQLVMAISEENTINFHAPEFALLTLSITHVEPQVDIRIFHHLQPHVYIRLTRSETEMTEAESLENKVKSCKTL